MKHEKTRKTVPGFLNKARKAPKNLSKGGGTLRILVWGGVRQIAVGVPQILSHNGNGA
jgi:hypothetical protein